MTRQARNGRQAVTLVDIANACGLKKGSVSQILQHDDARYSAATRQRVRETAERLGYRPNVLAQGFRTGKTGIIGVLVPKRIQDHMAQNNRSIRLMMGLEEALLAAGYKVLLSAVSEQEIEQLAPPAILLDGYVEGLIMLGMPSAAYLKALHAACPRLVVADEAPETVPAVVPDNFGGGHAAGDYAWEMGYRAFVFVSRQPKSPNLEARLQGFRAAVEARAGGGLEIPTFRGDLWSAEGADAVARRALPHTGRGTLWFCANDFLGVHALQVLRQAGRRVPEECAVMGFDNTDFAAYATPGLATLDVDTQAMGRECVQLLLRLMPGGAVAAPHHRVTLPVRLVPRPSVSRLEA